MKNIGLTGFIILALIAIFIIKPWHDANDPKPVVEANTSTVATGVATQAPAPEKKVASAAAPKSQGSKKNPVPNAKKPSQNNNKPQQLSQVQTRNTDLAKGLASALAQ